MRMGKGSVIKVALNGRIRLVRVEGVSRRGGWRCVSLDTGRGLRLRTGRKVVGEATRKEIGEYSTPN